MTKAINGDITIMTFEGSKDDIANIIELRICDEILFCEANKETK